MVNGLFVAKFGGSSMKDATAMNRSAGVAKKQRSSLVVVSATFGTTNALVDLGKAAGAGDWDTCVSLLTKMKENHKNIAKDLMLAEDGQKAMEELFVRMETLSRGISLLRDCTPKALDSLLALGEELSSRLFTQAMINSQPEKRIEWFDAKKVIRTDGQFGRALPLVDKIAQEAEVHLRECREGKVIYITQGFIGSTEEGVVSTLGRGGSDYSAALFAEALTAEVLEIWTDVAGIATTDPRLVKESRIIPEISFKEAAELATFGAKILHPTTLVPVVRSKTKVFVGSSYEPEKGGTWIKDDCRDLPLIRAMALRSQQVLLTLSTPKMLYAHGFLYSIFKIFNKHKISVDLITTSEISVALTVDDATLLNKALLNDLKKLCTVTVEENLTLVTLIGNNINHTPGVARSIFNSIPGINVRMFCLGASKNNVCFLVDNSRGKEVVGKLHARFIEGKE